MANEQQDASQFSMLTVIDNPIRADIIKALIEANGIKCHLFDENILKQNPWYTTAIGGIKLMVPTEDLGKAQTIVEKFQNGDYALDDEMYEQMDDQTEKTALQTTHQNENFFISIPKLTGAIIIIALIMLLLI